MVKWLTRFIVLWSVLTGTSTQADTIQRHSSVPSRCSMAVDRPCVGLVLGGGGARGGAHVGVLKLLEEQGIPVDIVVGTSMGAFVGGLYASGKTAKEIEELFQSANWNAGYEDDLNRGLIPNRRKRQLDQFPIQVDIGFDGRTFKMPRGFIQGQGMFELVNNLLGSYPRFKSFDNLPIPFRAIAADAETGEQVVLGGGDLAMALQTSMSLPGIVRPMERQGRLLVDGGIANNLPVNVAQSLGAELIIAVDIGSPNLLKEELNSSFNILLQLSNFLTYNNVAEQKALLRHTDVLIEPPIDHVSMLGFDKIKDTIQIGYAEANRIFKENATLQQLAQQHTARHKISNLGLEPETYINKIQLNNYSRLADDFILHRMGLREEKSYSPDQLIRAVDKLYAQGTIAKVNTSISEENEQNILNIDVEEKEWGPGYLDFKIAIEDDFDSFSRYQLGLSYRYTNLSPYGAEWYSTTEIGTDKRLTSELYWPIKNSGYFWSVHGELEREAYEYKQEDNVLGEAFISRSSINAGIGWEAKDKLDIIVSALYIDANLEPPAIIADLLDIKEISAIQSGTAVEINFDSLDDATFPKSGWKLFSRLERTKDEYLEGQEYSSKIDTEVNGVFSLGKHSWRSLLRYQSIISDDTQGILSGFELGGFLNLSGMPADSLFGQHVRFFNAVYTYEILSNDFGAIRLPIYLGMSIEAGNAWDEKSQVKYDDLIKAGSLFIGWDGILGPTYLAYGRTEYDDNSFYFYVGVTF